MGLAVLCLCFWFWRFLSLRYTTWIVSGRAYRSGLYIAVRLHGALVLLDLACISMEIQRRVGWHPIPTPIEGQVIAE